MCRTETKAPIVWSSLTEHLAKTILYSMFLVHAVRSARRSSAVFSYIINSLIGLLALWMTKGEVNIAIKRIQRKMPPGYLGFPIIREIKFLATIGSGGVRQEQFDSRSKYGSFFSRSFLGRAIININGQDDIAWLFNNDRKALTEVSWPPNIQMLLGPGSVGNRSGKYHRVLRRLLEPSFAPKFVMNNYLTIMDETTMRNLDDWSLSGEFLSSEVFKMYALRLFYASSFGRIDEKMVAILHDDFKLWLAGFISLIRTRIPGMAFDEAMKARDRILDTLGTLIDAFTNEYPEESEQAQTTIIGRLIYGRDKDDNRVMTRDEMKDNILSLMFAGHDTTYASISTLIYHLCQNPDAMEALVEEVDALSEPLKSDELKTAPVLNACLHESWRMDPPAPGGFRRAVKDVQHDGYSFDKGTIFNYSIIMATKDDDIYKNQYTFNMKRFLPKDHALYQQEIDSGIDPLAGRTNYPIFGGGTHACLGKAFAQLELRVLAARMMKHYKVEIRNPRKEYSPVNGWKIEFKLTKRKSL